MRGTFGTRKFTAAQAALLDVLAEQPDPVGIDALTRKLGRHPNTVREQLNWLIERGLVLRHRVPGDGRGRPAWHYEAVGPRPGDADFAELAASLAWRLGGSARPPKPEVSLAHGRQWGKELAQARGHGTQASADDARAVTVEMLDDLGFAPSADETNDEVTLLRCPLLQAAHEFPQVVCTMHQGLVEGALEVHGADPTRVTLEPFGRPDGCALRLLAGSG